MTGKKIRYRHLVSLNTASIKLRSKHPRISDDLKEILEILKEISARDAQQIYKPDGLLDIED